MISRVLRVLAPLALLAALSCGGDDAVAAPEYAESICTGVGEWVTTIQSQTEELEAGTADIAGDPEAAKESVESYLDEVIAATDELLEEVEGAGQPDVEDGEEVATELQRGFEQVKEEFEKAREDIEAVDTDDPEEFADEFERIGGRLQDGSAMEEAFSGFERFEDNEELTTAFEEQEACKEIEG